MRREGARAGIRELLQRDGPLVSPGVYDCVSAKVVEQAGFDCAFISGAAVTASVLGLPDVGLESMPDVLNQARNIARAVDIPVLVDVDTGYGNAMNVTRTVKEFEHAGLAGIFIEDQTFPPRCGHFEGRQVIPTDEMVVKITAACESRRNQDFFIIARTDSRSVYGVDDALERARRYRDAGADMIYVEGLLTVEELRRVASEGPRPLQANVGDEGGSLPALPFAELHQMGYKLISYSGTLQRSAIRSMQRSLNVLQAEGTTNRLYPEYIASLAERSELLGLAEYLALDKRLYAPLLTTEPRARG
jgi:2-methylisocitrate lyase-like PEP mutase family enzyme